MNRIEDGGAAVATISKKKNKMLPGQPGFDFEKELEFLRSEIKRYESIFDSARMIVGHELNRPLTSISGYLQLLEAKYAKVSGEKELGYFSKAKKATEDLQDLIEAFVQMLRFDRSSEKGEDLEEIVLFDLVESLKMKYFNYPPGVVNSVDRDLPPLFVRARCLEIVLDNLISNGLKHGGNNGPVVVSAVVQLDRRGISRKRLLIITVRDHGSGISEEEIKEIFDPFYRGSSGKEVNGLGLGLSLVKNVINVMMGDIQIKSDPGSGVTATIAVPIQDENPDPYERIG
ncbi:MAG: HAMP domain-containing histidine kinase [Candidatus Krumholzibacteriota bacterium]|nr:HAMP domain-containing histidine kinase [Candidatus Krumholzibacteriota bacterium]